MSPTTCGFEVFAVYGDAGPAEPKELRELSRWCALVLDLGVSCPFSSQLLWFSAGIRDCGW
jgi:hypothetical protein